MNKQYAKPKHPVSMLHRHYIRFDSANGYQKYMVIPVVLKKVVPQKRRTR